MSTISIIVAIDKNNGIGKNNQLLCHLPADMKHFKETTSGHTVIMGRKTWESLKVQPLPNRRNIVVSTQKDLKITGAEVVHSIEAAVALVQTDSESFVIGGDSIYSQFLPHTSKIYLTEIDDSFDADAFFPKLDLSTWAEDSRVYHETDEKNKFNYSFVTLVRR